MLADIFGPCRCAARPGAAHRCVFAENDFNFICTMDLKPSHQKGTICEPKMGATYEPKMVTKYEPKTGTKYEPKMGTDFVLSIFSFSPGTMRAQNGHEIRAQNGYSNVFISGLFCPLAKTQAGPHLHARSLYTNHAASLDRSPSPHPAHHASVWWVRSCPPSWKPRVLKQCSV